MGVDGFPVETGMTRDHPVVVDGEDDLAVEQDFRPLPRATRVIGVGRVAVWSRARVCGPSTPSRERPSHFWNASTAVCVCGPSRPSASAGSRYPSDTRRRWAARRPGTVGPGAATGIFQTGTAGVWRLCAVIGKDGDKAGEHPVGGPTVDQQLDLG